MEIQKITAHIPKSLLLSAQKITGKGITETIKAGLQRISQDKSYERMLKLKGQYKFSFDLNELREDHDNK